MVWRKDKVTLFASIILLMGCAAWGAVLQQVETKKPLQWVGLFNNEMIVWLENENTFFVNRRVDITETMNRQDPLLQPKSWFLDVKEQPRKESKSLGRIAIHAMPGEGLTASFLPIGSDKPVAFTPDIYCSDWGYGPYFHQTVLQRRGSWFQLPKMPFPRPVWINLEELSDPPHVLPVTTGEVYTLGNENIVVVDSDDEAVIVREEDDSDTDYDKQLPQQFKTRRIPYGLLFRKDAHLRLKFAYIRGT